MTEKLSHINSSKPRRYSVKIGIRTRAKRGKKKTNDKKKATTIYQKPTKDADLKSEGVAHVEASTGEYVPCFI